MYVLEDREVIDINKAFLGDDPDLEKKITYLGKVTNRVHGEFPSRREILERLGLPDKKIILVSLGRNQRVGEVSAKLLEIFQMGGVLQTHQIVFVLDPYLDQDRADALRGNSLSRHARFLDFFPDMVDLVNQSELVISRAGYNIVNEILLTGVKAVLIPESHGGGEQEFRAKTVDGQNIRVSTEQELLNDDSSQLILDHLTRHIPAHPHRFDKYAVGKVIIEDLERWKLQALRRRDD
jgi:predicted glycosyltransferase